MPQGIGSHGMLLEMKPAGSSTWTQIGEVGDIQMPGFMRNEHDITSHNRNIDTWVLGVLRRDPLTFPMFYNKAITSQQLILTAMLDSNNTTNMTNGFRLTGPDGEILIFSGGVSQFKRTQPVDGVQTANVTVRGTGNCMLDGIEYGN